MPERRSRATSDASSPTTNQASEARNASILKHAVKALKEAVRAGEVDPEGRYVTIHDDDDDKEAPMSGKHSTAPRRRPGKSMGAPFAVPVSTFAPRPFELRRPMSAVIAPCPGGYSASFLDANLATSGDTEAEALDNLKDLLLMVFEDFEKTDDATLGPAMLKQKSVLLDVIARRT